MNKLQKISTGFFVASLLITNFSFLASNPVFAAYNLDEAARTLAKGSPIDSPEKIFEILGRIVSWTYTIFFIVAVFFILVAAFNFLFARGDPEKIKSARSQILWAVVAIAVALISVGAAQIIKTFLKNPGA